MRGHQREGGVPGDLTGARLYRADLSGARLVEANLTGTDLSAADLTAVKYLTQQQLDSAQDDDETKLPAGRQRPAHWPGSAAGTATGSTDQ